MGDDDGPLFIDPDECIDIPDGSEPESSDEGQGDEDEPQKEFGPDQSNVSVDAHKESALAVAISPKDATLIATGGQDDVAYLWRISDEEGAAITQVFKLEGHSDSVIAVAFSSDGKYVATGSYDSTVRIWNPETGVCEQKLEGPSSEVEFIVWHPKGHVIVAGSADSTAWMWWAPTGKVMQVFAGHGDTVTCGAFGHGGKVVCTASLDKGAIVWDPKSGLPKHRFNNLHGAGIISIACHATLPIMATGSDDASLKITQVETGKEITELLGHSDSVEVVEFNNDKDVPLLATAGLEGKIQVWDCNTWQSRCVIEPENGQGIVRGAWLFPGGQVFVSASVDATVRVWDGRTGTSIKVLTGHRDGVLDLALTSRDENKTCRVATVSDDKTLKLWDVGLVA